MSLLNYFSKLESKKRKLEEDGDNIQQPNPKRSRQIPSSELENKDSIPNKSAPIQNNGVSENDKAKVSDSESNNKEPVKEPLNNGPVEKEKENEKEKKKKVMAKQKKNL
ncbi:hypothetical protein RFI_08129 [Reticulomyxa filosa]|uniref:Uncharacterized protein n=1 Tax=Reticulomyxa filosa TaxID=46433 RepID=X6NSM5_RETFI|nr:hypothetical protein RFI_08129 [Reticulomyxa filosa]|eukprot:ETO28996.1 hypothetical protein RFI_08129 [Reticulomyxa filosa]